MQGLFISLAAILLCLGLVSFEYLRLRRFSALSSLVIIAASCLLIIQLSHHIILLKGYVHLTDFVDFLDLYRKEMLILGSGGCLSLMGLMVLGGDVDLSFKVMLLSVIGGYSVHSYHFYSKNNSSSSGNDDGAWLMVVAMCCAIVTASLKYRFETGRSNSSPVYLRLYPLSFMRALRRLKELSISLTTSIYKGHETVVEDSEDLEASSPTDSITSDFSLSNNWEEIEEWNATSYYIDNLSFFENGRISKCLSTVAYLLSTPLYFATVLFGVILTPILNYTSVSPFWTSIATSVWREMLHLAMTSLVVNYMNFFAITLTTTNASIGYSITTMLLLLNRMLEMTAQSHNSNSGVHIYDYKKILLDMSVLGVYAWTVLRLKRAESQETEQTAQALLTASAIQKSFKL